MRGIVDDLMFTFLQHCFLLNYRFRNWKLVFEMKDASSFCDIVCGCKFIYQLISDVGFQIYFRSVCTDYLRLYQSTFLEDNESLYTCFNIALNLSLQQRRKDF